MSDKNREFDVVVWGATGFTGALVAEYLLEQYGIGGSLKWTIAGRNPDKLAAVKASLGTAAESLETILSNSFDETKLDSIVARTKVVISTVGPYAKYGSALVAACVKAGTH